MIFSESEILSLNIESLNRKELMVIRGKLHEHQLLFKGNYKVLHQWGIIEKKLNMPHAAEICFQKALKLHKEHTESMRELGTLYAKSERLNDALRLFASIVTIKPDDWEAWYKGGIILHTMHEKQKALAWLKMAKKMKEKG